MIDFGESFFEVFVRLDDDDRPEDLFVADLQAAGGACEDGGRDGGAAALAACDQLGPAFDCFLDPAFHAVGFGSGDERAYVFGVSDKLPQVGLENAALDENALHADARLAGMAEGSMRGALCCVFEVGPV